MQPTNVVGGSTAAVPVLIWPRSSRPAPGGGFGLARGGSFTASIVEPFCVGLGHAAAGRGRTVMNVVVADSADVRTREKPRGIAAGESKREYMERRHCDTTRKADD